MEHIPEEYERGRQESLQDIALSSPKLFWQTRGSWGELLTQLMVDRFAVAVVHISDITWSAKASYQDGYNSVTKEHICKVYGGESYRDVFDEVDKYRTLQY